MEVTDEQIEYFLFEDGDVSGKRFKERAKFWSDFGLGICGYNPVTEQVRLEMRLYRGVDDNLERTVQAMEKVLPFVKDFGGVKRFKVLEHTLSKFGVYIVEIGPQSYTLTKTTFGRKSKVAEFTTLRELVEYVQENHFYQSSEDSV